MTKEQEGGRTTKWFIDGKEKYLVLFVTDYENEDGDDYDVIEKNDLFDTYKEAKEWAELYKKRYPMVHILEIKKFKTIK